MPNSEKGQAVGLDTNLYSADELQLLKTSIEAEIEKLNSNKAYLEAIDSPPEGLSNEVCAIDVGRILVSGKEAVEHTLRTPMPWSPAQLVERSRSFTTTQQKLIKSINETDYKSRLDKVSSHSWLANKGPFWTVIYREMATDARQLHSFVKSETGSSWNGLLLRLKFELGVVGLNIGFILLWEGRPDPTVYFFVGPSFGLGIGGSLSAEYTAYYDEPDLQKKFMWFSSLDITIGSGVIGTVSGNTQREIGPSGIAASDSGVDAASIGLTTGLSAGIRGLGTYHVRLTEK